jgi:hypothetical protein
MRFKLPQVFLPDQVGVARRNKAALAGNGIEKAFLFKLVIRALGGDNADMQILG